MRHLRGFSLLEILVAFTILALALGVAMRIFSGSLSNADMARSQAQAAALAQSLLAGAGVETPLAAGGASGTMADKYRWQLEASPYEKEPGAGSPDNIRAAVPRLELWRVRVRVAWGGGNGPPERDVVLDTLRVQTPPRP